MKTILNLFGIYTKSQLISFGKYMVSDERSNLLLSHPEKDMQDSYIDRLKDVSHADLENWK